LNFADNTNDVMEESGSFATEPWPPAATPPARDADVLTREARCNASDRREVRAAAFADVREPPGEGKSVSKDKPVGRVDLDLPDRPPTGLLKPKIKTSDACEERSERLGA
jgi:hypothetical protein